MKRFLSLAGGSKILAVLSFAFLIVVALLAPTATHGQISEPGWFNISASFEPTSETNASGEKTASYQMMFEQQEQSDTEFFPTGLGAEEATPVITELARGLKNDPLFIYEYVKNHIDYEPYFGSLKGATGTYLEGSGNDFDQAALMVALLRVGGTTAQYGYGLMTIPVTHAANWLGVSENVTNICNVFADGGQRPTSHTDTDVTLTQVWVQATIGATNCLFFPAFKRYESRNAIDLTTPMGYDRTALLAAATNSAEIGTDYVRNLSETGIRNKLLGYSTNLANFLRVNHPNDDIQSIIGGRRILEEDVDVLPTTLPFSSTQCAVWDSIPTGYVHQVRIQCGTMDATLNIPELNGAKLAITTYPAGDNTTIGLTTATNTLFFEDFESAFPGEWDIGDDNPEYDYVYWDDVESGFGGITPPNGEWMGYCAGNGYLGTEANPTYQNRMKAYMQRTVDLSDCYNPTLTFRSLVAEIDAHFDFCRVFVNGDNVWQKEVADAGWTTESIDLSAYIGLSSVTIRFEFGSDASIVKKGWFLDNIALTALPGDKFDNAIGIPRNTDVAGTIATDIDQKVYRVRLRKNGHYVITATLGTLNDSEMWLFSPSRSQLAYNDDGSGLGLGSKITYDCTSSGDYYIVVDATYQRLGSFTLRVAESGTPVIGPSAVLWRDDTNLVQEADNSTPLPTNLVLTIQHPYCSPSYASNACQRVTYPLKTGGSYVIIRGFDSSEPGRWLRTRQRQLESYRARNLASNSREIVTETLNIIGQTWMEETSLAKSLIDRLAGVRSLTHHRFGLMAQETGFYIDVKAQISSMTIPNGNNEDLFAVLKAKGLLQSAVEHAVLEQMQGTNRQSASTVKLIKLANQNGNKIYFANSSNYLARVQGAISYTSAEKATFSNLVAAGGQILLPETNSITLNQWRGKAYMSFIGSTNATSWVSMVIGGDYFGGYSGDEEPVNADNVTVFTQPVLADRAAETHNQSKEPVDLVTGAYLSQNEDLSLGTSEPRGLRFVRTYNSDAGNQKSTLGYGWTHSYNIRIQENSDYRSGLATRAPVDVVPAIVGILATFDLCRNENSAKGWTTAVLANQWITDQLTDNARNIMLGSKALTFVRLPDGTFNPPPGVTSALALTNGFYRMTERFGTRYDFNSNKVLSSLTDVDGNALTFQYNTATNLQTVTDCYNRQLTLTYSGGLLTSVSHAGTPSRTVSYAYTTAGDLKQCTDPQGYVWKYACDNNHRIVSLYDPTPQLTITNIYDSVGHVKSQKNGLGNTWNFYFSDYRNVEEDPQGGQKVYYYDSNRRSLGSELIPGYRSYVFYDGQDHPIQTVDVLGNSTWYLFDGNQNLTNRIDALTNSTHLAYDSFNHLISTRDPLGGLTQYYYDTNHHLTNTVDAAGHSTASSYYTSGSSKGLLNTVTYPGNIFASYTYSNGQVASVTRTDAGVSSMQYDGVGNRIAVTDPNNKTTQFAYDKRRLLTSVKDPLNNLTSNVYNSAGLRIKSIDALGRTNILTYTPTYNIASIKFPNGGIATNTFDNRDLPVLVTNPRGYSTSNTFDAAWRKVAVIDPLANQVILGLDPLGNPVSVTNALGQVTTTIFDPLNRPVAVTDPLQRQWLTSFDARGAVADTTDARNRVTRYATDALGRRTRVTYPSGRVESFALDALGRMTAFTNSEGHVYRLAYDGQGRLITATNGANEQVFRNYFDPVGNLTNKVDGASRPIRFQYDALNHCTNTIYSDGSTEAFTFDAVGNLLTAKNAATTNTFAYDVMNHLTSSVSRVAGVAFTNQYRYDLGGLATNVVYPDGKTVRYAFDPDGNVTNITDWANHTWRISRDAAGRVTMLAYPNGISGSWGYDASSAVTNWSYTGGGGGLPGRRITRDVMGLKTREDVTGPMPVPSVNRRAVNTFNDADRLVSAQVTIGTNTCTETYLHDSCGAMTNISVDSVVSVRDFSYDLAGRMTSASASNLSFSASYDALGNRVKTTLNGTTRLWVIDHTDPLKRPLMETTTNGTPVRYYIWGAGRLLGIIESNGALRCVHSDEQGNVVALSDASGNATDTFAYGPYGEDWGHTGTNSIPFRWLGSYGVWCVSEGTTLYLTRHRAYDTTLKRFLSQDPLGLGGGGNLYSYALGNPLSFVDVLGLCPYLNRDTLANPDDSPISDVSGDWIAAVTPLKIPLLGVALGRMAESVVSRFTESQSVRLVEQFAENEIPQILKNKVAGDAFRDEIAQGLKMEGRDVATEVYKRTPLGKRYVDIEVSLEGKVLGGIETKVGGSRYTPLQRLKDTWLQFMEDYPVNVVRDR